MAEVVLEESKSSAEEELEKRCKGCFKKEPDVDVGNVAAGKEGEADSVEDPVSESQYEVVMSSSLLPSAKQTTEKVKGDGSRPLESMTKKQCKLMLPLTKTDHSVPAYSNDGPSRDPAGTSVSRSKNEEPTSAAEPRAVPGDEKDGAAIEANLPKKRGRGRPRKYPANDKISKDLTTEESVKIDSAPQNSDDKASGGIATDSDAASAQPIKASDLGLGIELSWSGSGAATEREGAQDVAQQPPKDPLPAVDKNPTAAPCDPSLAVTTSPLEPPKKRGRGRPCKVSIVASTPSLAAKVPPPVAPARTETPEVVGGPTDPAQKARVIVPTTVPDRSEEMIDSKDSTSEAQPEPPKKRGRGRPPGKAALTPKRETLPPPSAPEDSKLQNSSTVSDLGAMPDASGEQPLEKRAKVDGEEAVGSGVSQCNGSGLASAPQEEEKVALALQEVSKNPSVTKAPLPDDTGEEDRLLPEKKAKENDINPAISNVPSKSPLKRSRGRPPKNAKRTELRESPPPPPSEIPKNPDVAETETPLPDGIDEDGLPEKKAKEDGASPAISDVASKSPLKRPRGRPPKNIAGMLAAPTQRQPVEVDATQKQPMEVDATQKQPMEVDVTQKQPMEVDATQKQSVEVDATQKQSVEVDIAQKPPVEMDSAQKQPPVEMFAVKDTEMECKNDCSREEGPPAPVKRGRGRPRKNNPSAVC